MGRKAFGLLGVAIALLCAGFLTIRVFDLASEMSDTLMRREIMVGGSILSICYGASLFLLALAWAELVGVKHRARLVSFVRIYGVTSLAKYLPGNLFHIVGRQVKGVQAGASHSVVAVASLMEIVLTIAVAAAMAWVAAMFAVELRPYLGLATLVGLAGPSIAVVLWVSSKAAIAKPYVSRFQKSGVSVRCIARVTGMYFLFFSMLGAIAVTGFLVLGGDPHLVFPVAAAYLVAWIVGFVTPGASGGLGVREATLVLILTPMVGDIMSLSLAILIRIITTLGDGAFFLIATTLNKNDVE